MRHVAATLVAVLAACTLQASEASAAATERALAGHGLQVQADNDEFAGINRRDRWYSSGVRASYLAAADPGDWRARMLAAWCDTVARCAAAATPSVFFSIGQNIYTQNTRTLTVPSPHDRPLAGWLYLAFGAHRADARASDAVMLQAGVTGPASYGEQVQNRLHSALGVTRVPAWHYQLRPRLGVDLRIAHARRHPVTDRIDLVTRVAGSAGNVLVRASAGAMLRTGSGLRGAEFPSEAMQTMPGALRPGGWVLFAGVDARATLWDVFLDGQPYGYEPAISSRPLSVEGFVGAALALGLGRIAFTLARRTIDFRGPGVGAARYAPQTVGWLVVDLPLP